MAVTIKPTKFSSQAVHIFNWSTKDYDPDQVRRSSFGLPYRDMNAVDAPAKVNNLIKEDLRKALTEVWGVSNAEEVRKTVEAILGEGMHTPIFDAFLQLGEQFVDFQSRSSIPGESEKLLGLQLEFLQQLFAANGYNPESAADYRHWINLRLNPQFQMMHCAKIPTTTRAWDLMRVEAFAGRAVACGWLDPAEYEDMAARTVRELQASFATWSDVARSFWWGRAMWLSDEITDIPGELGQFNELLTAALTSKKSPWVRVPLHPTAEELDAKLGN